MRLSPRNLVLLTLYLTAAVAFAGAAVLFASFKDELRPQAPQTISVLEEDPSFKAFEAPAVDDTALESPQDLDPVELLAEGDSEEPDTADWHLLEPIDRSIAENTVRIGQSRAARQRTATIVVITNFEKARVTVNGVDYPSYSERGENEGIVVPAGGPHHVLVNYNGNEKLYEVNLQPNETRYLLVELSGFRSTPLRQYQPNFTRPPVVERAEEDKAQDEDGQGRITVYSRPRGQIFIGGQDKGQATPGTIEVESGRHDVQVKYEDGEMSEKKVVRVRQGSRIKLFFRQGGN
jgi:hypothetical protein